MATTSENRDEPLTETFATMVRKLTGADSPTGDDVELQTVERFTVAGAMAAFLTGAATSTGSPTYAAGTMIGDPLTIASFSSFVGAARTMNVHGLAVIDPSYTLDADSDGVGNFALTIGAGTATFADGDSFAPDYSTGVALGVTPIPTLWQKVDLGVPGTPTGARYLIANDLNLVMPGADSIPAALVATADLTGAFLAAVPNFGQAAVVAIASLL